MKFYLLTCALMSLTMYCQAGSGLQQGKAKEEIAKTQNQKSIRDIDFKNFTFKWKSEKYKRPTPNVVLELSDGTKEEPEGGCVESSICWAEYGTVIYGQFNDDSEGAVVTLTLAAGGSSRLSAVLLVYVSTEKGIMLEKAFELGTAAYGGLRDVRFSRNSLIIEKYNREGAGVNGKALADAVCCPSTFTQQVFTRNNNQLLMISEKKFPNEFSYAKDLLIEK